MSFSHATPPACPETLPNNNIDWLLWYRGDSTDCGLAQVYVSIPALQLWTYHLPSLNLHSTLYRWGCSNSYLAITEIMYVSASFSTKSGPYCVLHKQSLFLSSTEVTSTSDNEVSDYRMIKTHLFHENCIKN